MPGKILVIDDENEITEGLQSWLEDLNYKVSTANNGVEGFQKASQEQPDLIILDVLMPGMTGYQVVEELDKYRRNLPQIPVIVISARPSMRQFFVERPGYAFIPKPFNQEQMLLKIQSFLRDTEYAQMHFRNAPQNNKTKWEKVLLVEVEKFIGEKLKEFFEAQNMEAMVISDTEEVLPLMRSFRPDLILCRYWEGLANIDAVHLHQELQQNAGTQKIPFYLYCLESVAIEAKQELPSIKTFAFRETSDLKEQLQTFLNCSV